MKIVARTTALAVVVAAAALSSPTVADAQSRRAYCDSQARAFANNQTAGNAVGGAVGGALLGAGIGALVGGHNSIGAGAAIGAGAGRGRRSGDRLRGVAAQLLGPLQRLHVGPLIGPWPPEGRNDQGVSTTRPTMRPAWRSSSVWEASASGRRRIGIGAMAPERTSSSSSRVSARLPV